MASRIWILLLSIVLATPLAAQSVGDTAAAVRNKLGEPQLSRKSGADEYWIYSNGNRVNLSNGVVTALTVLQPAVPKARPASVEYVTTSAPTPPPEAARPRASAPQTVHPARQPVRREAGIPPGLAELQQSAKFLLPVIGLCMLVAFVCNILIIITAFKSSVWWGLGYIFLPFASLVFVITHWDDTRKPFLVSLGASACVFLAIALSAAKSMQMVSG